MPSRPVAIPYCGFTLKHDGLIPKHDRLPLESVAAHIHIADVSARVALTQVFSNITAQSDLSAQYDFPIPARAAVCAFEVKTQGGKVIHGVVKENNRAKKEYEVAVSKGKLAGLLTEAHKDVFSISVGAIPANQDISVNITYVIDLSDDELLDQVRFQLSTFLAARYGSSPLSTRGLSTSSYARLSITVDIEMTAPILKVTCPSHTVEISLGPRVPLSQSDKRPLSHFARVSLTNQDSFLDQDFVLSIQAAKLDYPRCFAETLPNAQTIALSLTLVPRFELPPIPSQEYIFVIDRSGSMKGAKMDSAKRALIVLLKSLPIPGTSFNILSFGSSSLSMWEKSKNYAQDTLDDAINHVDGMEANMGGTAIGHALQVVFDTRNKSTPTALFLLTDGQIWELDPLLYQVRTTVSSYPKESYLRIFTLGIGKGASTALCEGVARVGNGACLMAIQSESIAGKCARLLKGSRTPPIGNLKVDWGVTPPITDTSPKPPRPAILVSSATSRDTCYDILTAARKSIDHTPIIPEVVTVRGDLSSGQKLTLEVPVQHFPSTSTPPLLHTLAARRLIEDIEDGKVKPRAIKGISEEDTLKAAVVKLSTEYQLTSRFASFVAVDESDDKVISYERVTERPIPEKPTEWTPPPPPPPGGYRNDMRFTDTREEDRTPIHSVAPTAVAASPSASAASDDKVTALARLQSFNGSFALTSALAALLFGSSLEGKLKDSISESINGVGDSKADMIWATVVACAFLEVKLIAYKEVWEGMWEKAKAFVDEELAGSGSTIRFEDLAEDAAKFF